MVLLPSTSILSPISVLSEVAITIGELIDRPWLRDIAHGQDQEHHQEGNDQHANRAQVRLHSTDIGGTPTVDAGLALALGALVAHVEVLLLAGLTDGHGACAVAE